MKTPALGFLALSLLLASDDPKDAVKKEIERFQGTWKFVSIEAEGKKVDEAEFQSARLVIKGSAFTLMAADQNNYRGTFKVDPSKKPKTMDVTFTEGPEKGKTALGIYELDGDLYKVCMALAGKERPTEFVSKADSGHVLEVLKREKK